jgi:hypothetical protein
MAEAEPVTHVVWIVRRGSGKAQVHPSPLHVRPRDTILVKNWTNDDATVGPLIPLYTPPEKGSRHASTATITIRPGGQQPFPVGAGEGFFEFDVTFPGGRYAEGNSKPGVIVDP